MTFDNPFNWETIYSGQHSASEANERIGRILIPGTFSQHIIRAYATSLAAKPSWWLGGTLTQILGSGNSEPDFEGSKWQIPLNRITLIRLPELTAEYRLKFEPSRWHREIRISIEKYTL